MYKTEDYKKKCAQAKERGVLLNRQIRVVVRNLLKIIRANLPARYHHIIMCMYYIYIHMQCIMLCEIAFVIV